MDPMYCALLGYLESYKIGKYKIKIGGQGRAALELTEKNWKRVRLVLITPET